MDINGHHKGDTFPLPLDLLLGSMARYPLA